ncbi:uncharacterized protein LOC112156246 [Oryzias melastigma]|uniref:uncharacterized protein LOC112156246 n=1 Tax=Oryzias melastigma TaxID=30732 RepID=UPI00168CDB00|nr:uncharacterized protein LOC112156246 [Oryzias melastigma]
MMNERGKMKPLLISLLLVVCFSLSFSSNWHKVPQTADFEVSERETVNASCCVAKSIQRGRVKWFKNKTKIAEAVIYLKDKHVKCLNSTLSNFSSKSWDIYSCKVFIEIPVLTELEGNVTFIRGNATEEQRDAPTGDKEEPPPRKLSFTIIAALAVALPLILITTICFCWMQKRRGNTSEVIYDVPHFDSTGAEMEKHSTSSSRGSSQWCQVPLYESLAYFEKVEDKESE